MAQQNKSEPSPGNLTRGFPKQVKLPDGVQLVLRLMQPADREKVLSFARSLPPDDLLFLRTDITEPAVVDAWIADLQHGGSVTVLAFSGELMAGYATLHLEQARWTRRVGEIRVQVAPDFRGRTLGRRLTGEIHHLGQLRGIKKMAAMMTPDQPGARAAFERLGFEVEALLKDWVMDRMGRPRDLLIMSYEVGD